MKTLLINKIEELDWNVSITDITDCEYKKYCFELSKFSPEGQDFNITVYVDDLSDFDRALYDVYDNYDVSEETMLWLDSSGHGVNGAPYDMKDVYEDMEACKDALLDLYDELTVYLQTL